MEPDTGWTQPRTVAIIGAGVAGIPAAVGLYADIIRVCFLPFMLSLRLAGIARSTAGPEHQGPQPQLLFAFECMPSFAMLCSCRQTIVLFERASEIGGVWRENYSGFGAQALPCVLFLD